MPVGHVAARRFALRIAAAGLVAAPALLAVGPASAALPSTVRVAQPTVAGSARHPLDLKVLGQTRYGTPLVTSTVATGYTPAQIRAYLGLTGTGSGQTIAIVTAYHAPNALADLGVFDKQFGLAAPPSVKQVNQTGGTKWPPVDGGWALETAMDLQWAHAVAPGASLLVVEASSSALTNLFTALSYAVKAAGVTVTSNSWGAAEFSGQINQDYRCKITTGLCVFASGDNGNPGLYPATNPWVLAVGGTSLSLSSTGTVSSEVAWSGSGGGVSLYDAKPSYQSALTAARRSSPDVAYDGDPATGVPVYSSTTYQNQSGWFQMGGTSAGTPQWAAVIAVANGLRKALGKGPLTATNSAGATPFHTALYRSSSLYDVVSGSNGTCGATCTAGTGYDAVTGLGTPRAGLDLVLRDLY